MPRNRYLVAPGQPQVGQAAVGVATEGAVEVEHAGLYDVTRLLALPLPVGCRDKELRNGGVTEVDGRSFQVCPQLIPGVVARATRPVDRINGIVSLDVVGSNGIL